MSGVVEHYDVFKIVAETGLVVVGVVRGGDLHAAGAELAVNVFVGDDRDLTSDERQDERFADKIGVSFVIGSDCHGGVAEDRLRARRGNGDEPALFALDRVFDVPEGAFYLLVLDLRVGNDGVAVGADVRYAQTAVDEPLIVERNKDLAHGVRKTVTHCERFAAPVAGGAELFELAYNAVAVLLLPCPDALKEFFAPKIIAGDALVFAEVFFHFYLCCNARVVCAGDPQGVVSLHALCADKDILKRFVKSVPHVELTRDVRGRDDDAEGRTIVLGIGGEVALLRPHGVYSVLKVLRIIDFRKFVILFHFMMFLS